MGTSGKAGKCRVDFRLTRRHGEHRRVESIQPEEYNDERSSNTNRVTAMPHDAYFAIDTTKQPWEERFNEKLGRALYRKDLYTDAETGAEVRLVKYPRGVINPKHTHPCGHGMYVLEGTLVT